MKTKLKILKALLRAIPFGAVMIGLTVVSMALFMAFPLLFLVFAFFWITIIFGVLVYDYFRQI